MAQFDEAARMMVSLPLCRMLLAIIAEHLQHWGELPTAEELQRKAQQPGA